MKLLLNLRQEIRIAYLESIYQTSTIEVKMKNNTTPFGVYEVFKIYFQPDTSNGMQHSVGFIYGGVIVEIAESNIISRQMLG